MTPDAKPAENKDSYQVVMPKLGLTMTEATLVEWLRADGELVEKGEPLFVLESEKSTLEIEAPAGGWLHILVLAGETVPVQTPIARLDRDSGTAVTHPEAVATPRPAPATTASPKARALARRLGISLAGIEGTGVRDMIVAADVERAYGLQSAPAAAAIQASPVAHRLARHTGLDLSAVTGSGPGGRIMRRDVAQASIAEAPPARPEPRPAAGGEVQPFTGLRAIVAERLSASWRERPHVTLNTEADATNLVSARQQASAELGTKVSYDALLVALVARALSEHPRVNVRLTQDGIEMLPQANIGVAVDTERGLLVPVVHDAAGKNLIQIQQTLGELVERALSGRSQPDDLTGGTFTITNLGMFDVDAFTPIINPPESAILGVGRIVAKPVAEDRQVVVRDTITLSLSFDHRLIDGAPAARFLQRIKQLVERPFALAVQITGS